MASEKLYRNTLNQIVLDYLIVVVEAHSFPRAWISANCSHLRKDTEMSPDKYPSKFLNAFI